MELERRYPSLHVVDTPILDRSIRLVGKAARRVGLDPVREEFVCSLYARHIERELAKISPHVVISLAASHKCCNLRGSWPVIHFSDGLFAAVTRYYDRYKKTSARSWRLGNLIQQRLIDRSAAVILTSDWALSEAQRDYRTDKTVLRVVPAGANLDYEPQGDIVASQKTSLKLLFVGIDWHRKGGPLALRVTEILRENGAPKTELHVVGCSPPEARSKPGVTVHGRLSKADPTQRDQLDRLFREAAFLFVPSPQETFGLVYCEAAAYGLPSVACNTGGVPTIIRDGETGALLNMGAPPEEYARRILSIWNDRTRYDAMRRHARRFYERRLTWRAWGDAMGEEIERAVTSGRKVDRSAL